MSKCRPGPWNSWRFWRRNPLRMLLRNAGLGLLLGAVLGLGLGVLIARIRVPHPNPHNYGGLDRLVIGLSTMLIATSVGGLGGVFWGNQSQPSARAKTIAIFVCCLPGALGLVCALL